MRLPRHGHRPERPAGAVVAGAVVAGLLLAVLTSAGCSATGVPVPASASATAAGMTSPVSTSPVSTSPVSTSPVSTSPVSTSPVSMSPVSMSAGEAPAPRTGPAPTTATSPVTSDASSTAASPGPGFAGIPTSPPAAGTVGEPTGALVEGLGFRSSVSEIDATLASRMALSWRPGCPVPLADLRYLTLTYRGADGADHLGELVVAAKVADDVVVAFGQLYAAGYPIASMRLVDDFGGDDDASMAADNTSAFNCRPVTGGGGFSQHSYGTAVDVNPVENPYVRGGTVLPPAGRDYLSRPELPGVLHAGDAVVAAFADIGWSWGGDWSTPTDYQHFSLSGR